MNNFNYPPQNQMNGDFNDIGRQLIGGMGNMGMGSNPMMMNTVNPMMTGPGGMMMGPGMGMGMGMGMMGSGPLGMGMGLMGMLGGMRMGGMGYW